MSLWGKFHDREERATTLDAALQAKISECRQLTESLDDAERVLEREQTRRIAAESIAEERRAEIERMTVELKEQREQLKIVMSERLKSLDALNLKLMESRIEEKPPNMEQFKRSEESAHSAIQTMRRIRESNMAMDMALITRLHPNFQRFAKKPIPKSSAPEGIPMNEVSAGEGI